MPEKPKEEPKPPAEPAGSCDEKDEDLWESDQKERGYYYDDAHGYEVYEDEVEADDEHDDQS